MITAISITLSCLCVGLLVREFLLFRDYCDLVGAFIVLCICSVSLSTDIPGYSESIVLFITCCSFSFPLGSALDNRTSCARKRVL